MSSELVLHGNGQDGAYTWLYRDLTDKDIYTVVYCSKADGEFETVSLRASEELKNGKADSLGSRYALMVLGIAKIEERLSA